MKIVLLLCLSAVALARPQEDAVAVVDEREGPADNGAYSYNIQIDNGIAQSETGNPGEEGQINAEGSYTYTDDDGNSFTITYVADERGFQPQGDHLPVAPLAPPHVAELLRIADEQRAAGITFERK
ncbi:cuticle protein AMP1A-like [Oratosquilla oratoria]|uniref:cuticle protein AMP1A-like n=1 Tax=Oratosquilla oratoria TaxID=337810 RepID=UPI003F7779CC